jgi:UDP-N-acetylmuramate: L-alanyl-gamma-D-glutamyl-meso-diaminopimelate ligase
MGVLQEGEASTMEVYHRGQHQGTFSVPLAGRHNGLNLLGSLGLLLRLGLPIEGLKKGAETFRGVRRRQEVAGDASGVLLIDDFAHHPTAVRETLSAVRTRYPGRRVVAVFEPRTHTSRRNVFQGEYAEAFGQADVAMCAPVYREETVPIEERFRPGVWVEDLQGRGVVASCHAETADLELALTETCRPGDVVLFMSSGSLADLIDSVRKKLGEIDGD